MPLSLAEALAQQSRPRKRPCGVRSILDTLPDNDREQLVAVLQGNDLSTQQICRALLDTGVRVSDSVVYRHRKGLCSCD